MPLGGLLSLGAAGIGAATSAGLFGGGSGVPAAPPPAYRPKFQKQADAAAYGGIGDLGQYNTAAQVLPQYGQLTQAGVNNPYAPAYQSAVAPIGGMGQAGGQAVYDQSLAMLPDVSALLQMGFDPQQAYYGRAQQRLQDQTRAALASRGIQLDPYGAGVEGNIMSNFNIDWENNLLQRALAGASGAGNLLGQAGQGINTGLGTMTAGAGLPYNTFSGINANALGLLSGYGQQGQQAANIPQTQIQDYLNYMKQGTAASQANNQAYATQLAAQQQGWGQNAAMGQGFGSALAGLKNTSLSNPFAMIGTGAPFYSNPYGGVANPTV